MGPVFDDSSSLFALGNTTIKAKALFKWETGGVNTCEEEEYYDDPFSQERFTRMVTVSRFDIKMTGRVTFSIKDDFDDVLDVINLLPGAALELPGGTGYSILSSWSKDVKPFTDWKFYTPPPQPVQPPFEYE